MSDAYHKAKMTRKLFWDLMQQQVEGVRLKTSLGSKERNPRGRVVGVHLVTVKDMEGEATIILLAATPTEYILIRDHQPAIMVFS